MKKTNIVLLALAFISQYSMAACVLDLEPPLGGASPTTLTIGPQVIRIDADAPVGAIIKYDSTTGPRISYKDCTRTDRYGKSVLAPLSDIGLGDKKFTTQITGIAVRPTWSNGEAEGTFPTNRDMSNLFVKPEDLVARYNVPAASKFLLEFYKTESRLGLSNKAGDVVLPGQVILYNWVGSDNLSNYSQQLQIGEITIISTPVCRLDGERTVDFNTVSSSDIERGVTRPLDFSLTCATDYGDYTVSASLITQTPSADNRFIQVTDNAGNADRLKIRIDNSTGTQLLLDGSNGESKTSTDNVAAQFNWSATLLRDSATDLPASGQFNASAEIVLLVN